MNFLFERYNNKYAYIGIPKNASTTLARSFFPANRCEEISFQLACDLSDRTFVVVLRDPAERWKTGFVEDWTRQDPNYFRSDSLLDYWQVANNQLHIGVHTSTQIEYVNKAKRSFNAEKFKYFYLDENFTDTFEHWMLENDFCNFDFRLLKQKHNTADNKLLKAEAIQFVKENWTTELEQKIKEFYKRDYNLLTNI